MLMLCSNGLTSEKLLSEAKKYMASAKSAAIVVTADNEYKENNYHVPRVTETLTQFGLTTECFDLDKQAPELLFDYDVVEFIGGNPYYLLDVLRKTNSKPVLSELAKNKILIAWSAGAIVMGNSLELIDMYTPEMNFMNLADLSGMRIADVDILPHYSKFLRRFDRFEEKCKEYEQKYNTNVIRLNDGDGIVIEYGTMI